MSQKDELNTDECQFISYHLPEWNEKGKITWKDLQLQHKSLNAQAKCILPPLKAIPVIFIPGIMGTNLKNKIGKPIWRADWIGGADTLYLIGLSGQQRRELLNINTTDIDDQGKIKHSTHSIFSDDGRLFPSREKRHWGKALYLSYGEFLDIFQTALIDDWQQEVKRVANQSRVKQHDETINHKGIISQLLALDKKFEHNQETFLTENALNHFKRFLFPVHVFGYNWLVDNAVSAAQLVDYIDEVIETYKYHHGHGLAIEKVILVTHSMGGLIARYAMAPSEDAKFNSCQDKVLGVVHGVIPDLGSPAAYRRMKTGAGKEGLAGRVLGKNAEELMSVLAFAPAPLQLLPSANYPANWLKLDNGESYPKTDPFDEIYLRRDVWWRLYEPDILDKDQKTIQQNEKSFIKLMRGSVRTFINKLDSRNYHPNSYLFYGETINSDGYLTWEKQNTKYQDPYSGKPFTPQYTTHDSRIVKLSEGQYCQFRLTQSNTAGDGTVPIESLNNIRCALSIKGVLATNVDHQNAFAVSGTTPEKYSEAIKFTLRAIVAMVQEVTLNEKN